MPELPPEFDLALLSNFEGIGTPAKIFDGTIMEAGNHLRWIVKSEMGLPEKFLLYRTNNQDISKGILQITRKNRSKDPLILLSELCKYVQKHAIPFAELSYTKWDPLAWLIKDSPNSVVLNKRFYASKELGQLKEAMAHLFNVTPTWEGFHPSSIENMHQKRFNSRRDVQKTSMRILDVLQIAALDPYIARMVGFYFIDRRPLFPVHGYFVEAHYGNRLWPLIKTEPLPPQNNFILGPKVKFGEVDVMAPLGRLSYDWSNILNKPTLTIKGYETHILRLKLSRQVQELIITIETETPLIVDGNVTINGVTRGFFIYSSKTEENIWTVKIQWAGNTFERVDFKCSVPSVWKIHSIAWRRNLGPMEKIISSCHIVDRSQQKKQVKSPVLTKCNSSPSPLVLKHPGIVTPGLSDLQLSFKRENTPELLNPANPVKMLYSKMSTGGFTPLNLNELAIIPRVTDPLPGLLLWMPLNGSFVNQANGWIPEIFGNLKFVKEKGSRKTRSASFAGKEAISFPEETRLKLRGDFTIFAEIFVDSELQENTHISIFFNGPRGYSLGIQRTAGQVNLRVKYNSSTFQAALSFSPERWTTIGLIHEGTALRLSVNNIPEAFVVPLGPENFNPGGLGIGADFPGEGSLPVNFFKGKIANVHYWQGAIEYWEAISKLKTNKDIQPQGPNLAPAPILKVSGIHKINTPSDILTYQLPALNFLKKELSIHAWVNIRPGSTHPTIVGNDYPSSFWFGLEKPSNQLKVWLNGRAYLSLNSITLGVWMEVGIVIKEGLIEFYINGNLDVARTHPNENINSNAARQLLRIGADTNNSYPLYGSINDLQIYTFATSPEATSKEFGIYNFNDRNLQENYYTYRASNIDLFGCISEPGPATSSHTSAPYHINAPLSLSSKIINTQSTINTVRYVAPTRPEEEKGYWEIETSFSPIWETILEAVVGNEIKVFQEKNIQVLGEDTRADKQVKQTFEIISARQKPGVPSTLVLALKDIPFAQLTIQAGDRFELLFDHTVQLDWQWSGLQQLYNPGVDTFQIFKKVGPFNELKGNVINKTTIGQSRWEVITDVSIGGTSDALKGIICTIDKQAYVIESHTTGTSAIFQLRYDGYPVVSPELGGFLNVNIPESHTSWVDYKSTESWRDIAAEIPVSLPAPISHENTRATFTKTTDDEILILRKEKQVDWLSNDSTLWTLNLTNFPRPERSTIVNAKDYVPGSLVINKPDPLEIPHGLWEAWYVHWHEWNSADTLTCYISLKKEQNGEDISIPVVRISPTYPVKFFPGLRFSHTVNIAPPFEADTPTKVYRFVVSARASSLQHKFSISRSSDVVTVNRRRPPAPPRPVIVSIAKPDINGNSEAKVRWPAVDSPINGFNLFRAVDSAIYSRDLDQRRLRINYYKDNHPFADDGFNEIDGDVQEFLRAIRQKDSTKFAPQFQDTFEKPLSRITLEDLFFAEKNDSHWNALNNIWQYWADRFYRSLSDVELRDIAERKGNEMAFTVVNGKPIKNNSISDGQVEYKDIVNGIINNRYFYRLRIMGNNLLLSTDWGNVSEAGAIEISGSKPRTPAWVKVQPGNREVKLEWALNTEPDLQGYILYRAEQPSLLEDLRWARIKPKVGVKIFEIKDPRILTEAGNNIRYPGSASAPSLVSLIGIFRSFEVQKNDPSSFQGAMNFLKASETLVTGQLISGLRRIENNTEVVIAWRDEDNSIKMTSADPNWPFADNNLKGLQDYYYKVQAISKSSKISSLSAVQRVRAFEPITPISAVNLRGSRSSTATTLDTIRIEWEVQSFNVKCIVQRRQANSSDFKNISLWMTTAEATSHVDENYEFTFEDTSAWSGTDYEYRIKTESINGIIGGSENTIFL